MPAVPSPAQTAEAIGRGICRLVVESSQIDVAYPASTANVHPGSLKPWVRGRVAVEATSIPIAARRISQGLMWVLRRSSCYKQCSICYNDRAQGGPLGQAQGGANGRSDLAT